MARISTYDRDLVVSRDDILIGTDAENSNVTRNFSVGSLIDFISLDSGGVVDTNYYLSAITADQDTGVVTFTVDGTDNQTLTLGTAAFHAHTDYAASNISFNTAQVVSQNDITAYYLNVSGNGTNGQLLASDGDGSFSWVNAANITDTNNYLNAITIEGSQITFGMQGNVADQTLTLGSAAFESVTTIVNQVSNQITIDDIDTSTLGDLASLDKVGANQIETNAITKLKIKDGEIGESKLAVSNNPVSGYVLTSDGSDGFSWVLNSASNYYLDAVTRNNETLTFSMAGGGTDVTFTYGEAAFYDVQENTEDRNSQKVAKADHIHNMSHISDAGSLATLNTVGTSDIDDDAVTAGKLSAPVGVSGQVLALDSGLNLVWQAANAGAASFLTLADTPSSYTANAGDILKVNAGINGLEFSSFQVSNVNNFTTVNTGTVGKVLAVDVNNDGSSGYKGLKWVDTSQVGATTFTALTDTPAALGTAHQVLVVNAAGTDLEYRTVDANILPDDIVTTAKIADDAITTALIADDAITTATIADNAVGTNQINSGAVLATKLASNAVETAKINALAVTTAKIADANVTLAKLGSDVSISTISNTQNTRTEWDTSGNTKIDWYVNGTNEMRLSAAGDLNVDGDVIAFSTTIASDKNLKNNIQNITNPIEKIKQLNGVTFNWARNGKESGGVIAQDVQQVMPSIVSSVQDLTDASSHLAVDYNGIIGLLIETVKEQQNQIDTLKAQLQA
jgi:hypothetical protein